MGCGWPRAVPGYVALRAFGADGKAHLILSEENTGSSPVTPTLGALELLESSPDFHSGDHRFEPDMPYVAVARRPAAEGERAFEAVSDND